MPGMTCWFAIFVNTFCNKGVANCFKKLMYYICGEKIYLDLSGFEKNSFNNTVDLSTFSKIMRNYGLFPWNYVNYVLGATLCNSTSTHNYGSLFLRSIQDCSLTLKVGSSLCIIVSFSPQPTGPAGQLSPRKPLT